MTPIQRQTAPLKDSEDKRCARVVSRNVRIIYKAEIVMTQIMLIGREVG